MRKYAFLLLTLLVCVPVGLYVLGRGIRPPSPISQFPEPDRGPAEALPAVAAPEPEPRNLGEKITYDLILGLLKVGSAEFHYRRRTVLDKAPADLVTFVTRMARFSDTETIYSDPVTSLPMRVERDVFIWPRREQIVEEYDQKAFSLRVTKRTKDGQGVTEFTKAAPVHNAILLPFAIRKVADLRPGWTFRANLPTQEFAIRLQGVERVRVPAGTFMAYRFISEPERFEIWISADERRIPLKIRGNAALGYIMVMRGYERAAASAAPSP